MGEYLVQRYYAMKVFCNKEAESKTEQADHYASIHQQMAQGQPCVVVEHFGQRCGEFQTRSPPIGGARQNATSPNSKFDSLEVVSATEGVYDVISGMVVRQIIHDSALKYG